MSLQITTTFETYSGLEVTQAYGRVTALDQAQGVVLVSILDVYKSEADFTAGKQPIGQLPFPTESTLPYNRTVDGVDILNQAHDNLINMLSDFNITAVKAL